VILRLVRMFGGGAFNQTEEHSTKEKGASVTEVRTAATPVEKEHGIVGLATQEGSTVHKKPAPEKRPPERAPKRAAKHTRRPSSPVRRSHRKGR
jgi:hypothetical protein